MDHFSDHEMKRAERMFQQLAAMCETLHSDADTCLEKRTKDYDAMAVKFDPGYEAPVRS